MTKSLADEVEALRSGIEDLTSHANTLRPIDVAKCEYWSACRLDATYWRSLVLAEAAHDLARRVREMETALSNYQAERPRGTKP